MIGFFKDLFPVFKALLQVIDAASRCDAERALPALAL